MLLFQPALLRLPGGDGETQIGAEPPVAKLALTRLREEPTTYPSDVKPCWTRGSTGRSGDTLDRGKSLRTYYESPEGDW